MKKSKTASVKEALLNGLAVISMLAFYKWYATRLSDIVFRLRKKNFPIVTGTPNSAYQDGIISDCTRKMMIASHDVTHFAVYYIKPSDLAILKAS